MDAGADAMPVPDRMRARWRSGTGPAAAGDPLGSAADDALLARIADGDAAALAALYRRYAERLFGFLHRYAGDRMDGGGGDPAGHAACGVAVGGPVRRPVRRADLAVRGRPAAGAQPVAGPPTAAGAAGRPGGLGRPRSRTGGARGSSGPRGGDSRGVRPQLRKPAIWIATLLPFVVFVGLAALRQGDTGLERYRHEGNPKVWMVDALGWFTPVLPMVFGIVLADRLVRDRRLGVAPLLDVTPAGRGTRLAGKYLGVCAATAAPIALVYLGVAVALAIQRGNAAALWWGAATFAAVVLPLLLLAGSLSFLGPQLMPTPVFRVLVVDLWFWAGATEADSTVPSLAGTVLSLTMDYPLRVLLGSDIASAGPVPGAALNVLRPPPNTATAVLSLPLMLGLAAAIVVARALDARTSE